MDQGTNVWDLQTGNCFSSSLSAELGIECVGSGNRSITNTYFIIVSTEFKEKLNMLFAISTE